MSAPVTDKHRELAAETVRDVWMLNTAPASIRSLHEHVAQATADAEARGREAGIREAAWLVENEEDAQDCSSILSRSILALLTPNKVKP